MTPDAAETLALRVLGFVAADDRALQGLQVMTGLDAGTLRNRAIEPEVLAGVLDFLLSDEKQLLAFCEAAEVDPHLPGQAKAVLIGEPLYN